MSREAKASHAVGERLPRQMGETSYPLSDGKWTQPAFPYTLWMAQRIQDHYKTLPKAEAAQVLAWLKTLGGGRF